MTAASWQKHLSVFDLVACLLMTLGPVGCFLAFHGRFSNWNVFLISLAVFAVFLAFTFRSVCWRQICVPWALVLILAFAATFRVAKFDYQAGGQDQGNYTTMSKNYQDTGSFYLKDPTMEKLEGATRSFYETLRGPRGGSTTHEGKVYLPFYPLQPVWLALFANIFGNNKRSLALTFLSLISLTAFYFLGIELTGRREAGVLTALILAVSPLHAFLAKFTVTEMPALCFTSLAMLYLVKFYKRAVNEDRYTYAWLVISQFAWFSFLLTRMSSMLYVPLIFAFFFGSLIFVVSPRLRMALSLYYFGLLALFALSLYIYRVYVPYAYYGNIDAYIVAHLGEHLEWTFLGFGILCLVATVFAIVKRQPLANALTRFHESTTVRNAAAAVIYGGLAFVIARGINKALNNEGITEAVLKRMASLNDGFERVAITNFWNMFIHLSPFLFVMFLVAVWLLRKTQDVCMAGLLLFCLNFIFLTLFFDPLMFGGFYYARFLLSEIVPYTTLFTVSALCLAPSFATVKGVRWRRGIVAATVLYLGWHLSFQQQGQEGLNPRFLEGLASKVTAEDLMVVHGGDGFYGFNEMGHSLKQYYRMNFLFVETVAQLATPEWQDLLRHFDKVYVLSMAPLDSPVLNFDSEHMLDFGMYHNNTGHLYLAWHATNSRIERPKGLRGISIPTVFTKWQRPYYLYLLNIN